MVQKFKLKPGQTDFTKIRWSPVVNCIVRYRGKILVVKRNSDMRLYPNCWNGISGFLDDNKSLKEKVREELKEETGISKNQIKSIKLEKIFDLEDPNYKKTWIVHPILVDVKTDKIHLDWEAQDYKWISPKDIKNMKFVLGFRKVLNSFFLSL
jgi:8-oxo-dGTP pyrophosphatase MutT (NUDIX family)